MLWSSGSFFMLIQTLFFNLFLFSLSNLIDCLSQCAIYVIYVFYCTLSPFKDSAPIRLTPRCTHILLSYTRAKVWNAWYTCEWSIKTHHNLIENQFPSRASVMFLGVLNTKSDICDHSKTKLSFARNDYFPRVPREWGLKVA